MKQSEALNKILAEARAAVKRGDKEGALIAAKRALDEDSTSLDAILLAASLCEPKESLAYSKQAIQLFPENDRARKCLAWAEQRINQDQSKSKTTNPRIKDKNSNTTTRDFNRGIVAGLITFFLVGLCFFTWLGFPQITITLGAPPLSAQVNTPTPFQYFFPTSTPTSIPTPTIQPQPTAENVGSYYAHSWDIQTTMNGTDKFWIEVDLSEQMLIAWQGDNSLASFSVSTGTSSYPTVTGSYKVYAKYDKYTMVGPGYNLPDVPYSLFFHKGYSIHGTYWHNNFGTPMSHGCVNMTISDAAWIYDNASIGTVVFVHP